MIFKKEIKVEISYYNLLITMCEYFLTYWDIEDVDNDKVNTTFEDVLYRELRAWGIVDADEFDNYNENVETIRQNLKDYISRYEDDTDDEYLELEKLIGQLL